MAHQLERFTDLADNAEAKLTELFAFAMEHEPPQSKFVLDTGSFLRLWAGRDPLAKSLVLTSRDEQGKLKGLVMAMAVNNPLFIKRPTIIRFVEIIQTDDAAFTDYVNTVLESL